MAFRFLHVGNLKQFVYAKPRRRFCLFLPLHKQPNNNEKHNNNEIHGSFRLSKASVFIVFDVCF